MLFLASSVVCVDTAFRLMTQWHASDCLYLASDVWGHGWRRLGVDVRILGHKARIVGGDAAEPVGCYAPWWQRLVWQAAAVARGGGGGWGGGVGLGSSTPATETDTTASPWRTGGATVGTVDAAAGGRRVEVGRGGQLRVRSVEGRGWRWSVPMLEVIQGDRIDFFLFFFLVLKVVSRKRKVKQTR